MTTCSDNHRLGRTSCGQTYGGEMQHCVARVSWSEHDDGYAHVTAKLGTIELMWRKGKGAGEPAEPSSIGLHQDARGVWRRPGVDPMAAFVDDEDLVATREAFGRALDARL